MEAVFDDFCPSGQPTTVSGGGIFTRLVDLIRRSLSVQDQTELALALGARQFGDAILAAESADELDEILEDLAWRREFHAYYIVLVTSLPPGGPTAEKITQSINDAWCRIPWPRAEYREKFDRLERAFITQLHADERAQATSSSAGDVDRAAMAAALGDLLFDITVPEPLMECLVGNVKCLLAQLAMTEAFISKRAPSPEQLHWLVDAAIEGASASLRLASPETPGISEFVKSDQFVDMRQVTISWNAARMGLHTAAKRAAQSGRKRYALVTALEEGGEGEPS